MGEINVWAHGNVSVGNPYRRHGAYWPKDRISLTWRGLAVSGITDQWLHGMFVATTPERRRVWMRRHRVLIFVLYAAIPPQVTCELLGWALGGGAGLARATWQWRNQKLQ